MSASIDQPAFAAIIPTVGRPTLPAAVRSALAQEPPPREVVVVVDGPSVDVVAGEVLRLPRVHAVATGGGRGPSAARMVGVHATTAPLIAFLDDDDEWLPGKSAAQLRLYAATAAATPYPVITCRAYVDTGSPDKEAAPERLPKAGEPLAAYMFDRRKVLLNGFMMGSSTLLTSRALLEREPMNERMRLHEDWEWLLRVAARSDAAVVMHPTPMVNYRAQPATASASRPRHGWRQSMAFADHAELTGRTRGDFLLCVTAPMALAHGERRAAITVAMHALRTARPGLPAWIVLCTQLVVPERLLGGVAESLRLRLQHRRRPARLTGGA